MITGATGVLGGEFARLCLLRGENVYLTARSPQKLSALRGELAEDFPSADIRVFACDLCDEAARGRLYADASGLSFRRLINVAGADIQKAFALYDEQKLVFQLRSTLEGALSMCLFCMQHPAEKLQIINISSLCGEYVMPYFAVYAAAKGALTSFSRALAEECRGSHISVTAVLPGAVYTRPDVVEYIKRQGAWGRLAAKTPQYVAIKSLKASDRGRRRVIPGLANKLAYLLSRMLPRGLMIKLNASMRKNTSKDAF